MLEKKLKLKMILLNKEKNLNKNNLTKTKIVVTRNSPPQNPEVTQQQPGAGAFYSAPATAKKVGIRLHNTGGAHKVYM